MIFVYFLIQHFFTIVSQRSYEIQKINLPFVKHVFATHSMSTDSLEDNKTILIEKNSTIKKKIIIPQL